MADAPKDLGQRVNVLNPDGEPENLAQSDIPKALKLGYTLPAPAEVQKVSDASKYGGVAGGLESAALGAAGGASFGAIPYALSKTGLVDPETQAGLERQHPIAHGVGEAAGIGAGLLAGTGEAGLAEEGGSALRALNPVAQVSKAGQAITGAVADALPEATGAVGKLASAALSHGLGSAVEGAAYGLGQSVNESALGDPDLNGEKILSNVGVGAMLGGGFGAALGIGGEGLNAIKGSIADRLPKAVSELDRPGLAAGNFQESVEANPEFTPAQKKGIIESLAEQKSNAPAIREAAERLGAPVLEGQTSASPFIQRAEDTLMNGAPTVPAIQRNALYRQGFDTANRAVESTLQDAGSMTKAEAGQALKDSLDAKITEQAKPINDLYGAIKEHYQIIPLSERSTPAIQRNIMALDDVRLSPSSPAAAIAKRVADEIPALKTVDDVKNYKSMLNQSLSPTASPAEKRMIGLLSEKLGNLEENSIVRFAETMKTDTASDRITGLLDQRKAANTAYKGLMGKLENLSEALGKKRVRGTGDFLGFMEDLTPEKVSDRLFAKNNSGFLNQFQKDFPEEFNTMRQYQRGAIRDAALEKGEFNPKVALKKVNALEPEIQKSLFSDHELQRLGDAKTYLDSFPKAFNPSGTSHSSAFRSFFEHPVGATIANVRDFGIDKFIKTVGSLDPQGAANVGALAKLERTTQTVGSQIADGAKSIFSAGGRAAIPAVVATGVSAEHFANKDDKSPVAKLQVLNSDPETLMNHTSDATQPLYNVAPNHAAGTQAAMMRATSFLGGKLPKGPDPKPLSPKYVPSKPEIQKFNRYYRVVENPVSVLHQIKDCSITPESMEALTAVYPKMLSEMQSQVMDQLTSHMAKSRQLSPATKMGLSLFLGQDLDSAHTPQAIQANQLALSTPGGQQGAHNAQQKTKTSQKGLSNLNLAANMSTASQSSAQRQGA